VLEAVDAVGGEPVEVRSAGGFERSLAVELGCGAVGEPVEDYQE
jgi:hypothetical protein